MAVALTIFCLASGALSWRQHRPRGAFFLGVLPLLWTVLAAALADHLVATLGDQPLQGGPWFGLSGIAWACAVLPAIPVALCPLRWRWRSAAAMALMLVFFGLADVLYLRFFGTIVPPQAARSAHQALSLFGIVRDLLERRDLMFLLLTGAALTVAWPRRQARQLRKRGRLLPWAALLAVLAAASPGVAEVRKDLSGPRSRVQPDMAQQLEDGFLRAHLFEISRVLEDRAQRSELSAEDRQSIFELTRRRAQESARLPHFGAIRGANVLIIQVEALAHWVVDAEVEGRPVTPFLQELRRSSRHYPRILDQTSDGRTSDAEYLVLNSLHPLPRGAVAYVHAENRFVALPALLRDRGYGTFSAHAFKRGFWNRGRIHPAYGFEDSYFRRELGEGMRISWGLADHLFFVERTVEILRRTPKPFFGFLVTLSTHPPFEPLPPGFPRMPMGSLEGTPLGRYLQVFHYFDGALRNYFERLQEEGLLDDTLVVIYGDHTAEGFDHQRLRGVAGLPEEAPLAAGLTFVPLYLRLPRGAPKDLEGIVPEVGGLLDIAPTILHLLGEKRPMSFLGRPLVPGGANRASRWKWKLAVGDGRIFVESKCKTLGDWSWRPRSDCWLLRKEGDEERRLSYLITTQDLAWELSSEER